MPPYCIAWFGLATGGGPYMGFCAVCGSPIMDGCGSNALSGDYLPSTEAYFCKLSISLENNSDPTCLFDCYRCSVALASSMVI